MKINTRIVKVSARHKSLVICKTMNQSSPEYHNSTPCGYGDNFCHYPQISCKLFQSFLFYGEIKGNNSDLWLACDNRRQYTIPTNWCGLLFSVKLKLILATTLQSMMNTKLSKQRFQHCYENGLIKTIQTIPHNLYVSAKLTSLHCGLRLILV